MHRPGVALLLAIALTGSGCRRTVSIPKASVPMGSARIVELQAPTFASSLNERVVVTHVTDGWHAFLDWSPEAGHFGPGDPRILAIRHQPETNEEQLWHPCSGTVWNLSGDYELGPLSGNGDQHLVALPFFENEASIFVDPSQQEAWRKLTSTTPVTVFSAQPGLPLAPASTPSRVPTPVEPE
jgi:hypothetical protein